MAYVATSSTKTRMRLVMALGLGQVLPGLGAAPGGRVESLGAVVPNPCGFLVLGNGEPASGLAGVAGH